MIETEVSQDIRARRAAAQLPALADPKREGDNRRIVKQGFWKTLRRFAAKAPFALEATAGFYAIRDPETPRRTKLLLLAALAYFVTPTDAIPDFLAFLGLTDDAAVFWAAWALARDAIKPDHLKRAETAIDGLNTIDPSKD